MPRARSSASRSVNDRASSCDSPQAIPISASRCSASPWREIRPRRLQSWPTDTAPAPNPVAEYRCSASGKRFDGQAVRRESGRPDVATPGRLVRTWPSVARPVARSISSLKGGDVCPQPPVSVQITTQPCSALAASTGGGKHPLHRCDPVFGVRSSSFALAPVHISDRTVRRSSFERHRTRQHRQTGRGLDRQGSPMTRRTLTIPDTTR